MGFYDQFKAETDNRLVSTTNGAAAYATSGKHLLDFNFAVSAMRQMPGSQIAKMFEKVYFEDKMIAVKYLFYLGDVREGLGERNAFRSALKYIIDMNPEMAKAMMELVPHYNRWDSILVYLDNDATRHAAAMLIKKQLKEDRRNMKAEQSVSLCAKWMPSVNASSLKTRRLARILCSEFGWNERKYRRRLSKLRAYLNVVEVKMSAKNWKEIDYEAVPSRANLIYNNAFLRNDENRRRVYLESLTKGTAKINASVLNPDEIIVKYRTQKSGFYTCYSIKEDAAIEALWKALPDLHAENTLVVRDGSGSMTWHSAGGGRTTPLDVATGLAIYMAEHNTSEWKDKFITFSAEPKLVDLSNCDSLAEKAQLAFNEADCSNTDIYKTMKLILNTAKNNNLTKEEMPKMIVIISDMQFDGRSFHFNDSLFDDVAKMYKRAGYELPKICFWNVDAVASGTIPMKRNENGLILCSGFSVQIMKMFMSGKLDPYEILLETLNSKRYDQVEEIAKIFIG